jgi:hypothetical protein
MTTMTDTAALPPYPLLTARAVRRRFSVAAWGSAAVWPLIAVALAPPLMWWMRMGADELISESGAAGMVPTVAILSYLVYQAVHSVRSDQRAVARKALELTSAARGDDPSTMHRAARDFGATLLSAYTPFNTRVLPLREATALARQIRDEAESGGLSPATARVLQELARMEA